MPVPSASAATPRPLLRDRALVALRAAIVDGTLEPGERLVDAELCAWLGVSRTPVREALTHLEKTGLVQIRPGSKTIVAPLDVRAAVEAQAVAAGLHELAAREAVPLVSPAHLATMTTANTAFAGALAQADVDAAIAADDAFHRVFIDLAANRMLTGILEDVTPLLRRMERVRFASLTGRASVAQHRSIIQHARDGDADGAARLTRANWMTLQPPTD
ncbi:GntR family transcriptional regulator [Kineosporia sp. NBRC 101731]|uniref:GntR family transcriptional regulator n=1 Tax=Kineosporia sp. NBRC 101731 TaxID=3032199 RepID=UPI0024A26E02|nr:GntR family transcriptional regulator [Kineosporia sp. NBRC 101731]GLY30885.1 putative transcriptional regulator, GntR family protein [Kineosporia sp. NBRC 101731]